MALEAKTITSDDGRSKGMFTSQNSALVLIDYQPEMAHTLLPAHRDGVRAVGADLDGEQMSLLIEARV